MALRWAFVQRLLWLALGERKGADYLSVVRLLAGVSLNRPVLIYYSSSAIYTLYHLRPAM